MPILWDMTEIQRIGFTVSFSVDAQERKYCKQDFFMNNSKWLMKRNFEKKIALTRVPAINVCNDERSLCSDAHKRSTSEVLGNKSKHMCSSIDGCPMRNELICEKEKKKKNKKRIEPIVIHSF